MTNDKTKGQRVYRRLLYFYENKIPVHFKLEDNNWRNGIILDLSEEKLTLVLKEFLMGEIPFLLEDINEDSIFKFEERK